MKLIPNKVDFYITNVCNHTCERCNRFNNYYFSGWQRWSDYEPIYEKWAKLVKLRAVTIMGGEPLLNPTVNDWINGINRLFGIEVQILTNGTRFKETNGLYQAMLGAQKDQNRNHIGVSLHNMDEWPDLQKDIRNFLQNGSGDEIIELSKDMEPSNRSNNPYYGDFYKFNSDFYFHDKNHVIINVYKSNMFGAAAIKLDGRSLHNSDPFLAHQTCGFVTFKSYHFIRGKFYKCAPVALLPEYDAQYTLNINDEDRQLLHSYRPLTVDNFDQYHEEFFANLDNVLPQCKFCPENHDARKIFPIRKGH